MNKKINAGLKITGIGCGQCGAQIIAEIEKAVNLLDGDKSNLSFIGINTSTEDLSSVTLSHKIHINNSKGAACDRNKSTEALADGIDEILEELQSYIIEDSIIFIAFSCGGGTGSAIAPILSGILKEMGYTVGMIPVLPADTEPLKVRDNARLTFNEIEELKPGMGSIFILDNNASDKITVNKVFASLFTGILCINNKSQDGNMDLAEIEACLKCPSFSVITKTNATKGTTANIIDILNKENNIFAKREDKTVTIMGISEAVSAKDSKIDIIQLRKEIGTAPTEFHGYLSESEENVIILSGLTSVTDEPLNISENVEFDEETFYEKVSAIQKGYDKLLAAQKEFNEYGSIAGDTLKYLTENDLMQYLEFTADGLNINTKALQNNEKALKDSATAELYNAMCNDIQNLSLDDTTALSNIAQSALKSLSENATLAGENASIAAQGWWEYSASIKSIPGVSELSGDRLKDAEAIINKYKKIATAINAVSIGQTSSKNTTKSGGDNYKENFTSEYNVLKYELEMDHISEKQYYDQLQVLNDRFFKDKKKYADEYRKYQQEIYKGLKEYYKTCCDNMMSYMQSSLESGKIDYNAYCNTVNSYLVNMYKTGKISAKDYFDYTEKMLNKQLSVYQSALKAITSILDKEIESWEKKIDAINDKIDELNQTKDNYDSILSTVDDVYQAEIENLNNQKDLLQDKIDSINDEADAYDLLKRKQEALYALEKAQQQRSKKIYIQGEGFVYRPDQDKYREAQENLKDIEQEEIIKRLEKEQELLENSISDLEKYRDLWKEIPDAYIEGENQRLTASVLGKDYEKTILLNRISDINDFKDKYMSIQSEINSNEELIKSYEEKKDYYSQLKDQWQSITEDYETQQNYLMASQLLGADWESKVLSGRIDVLNNFKNQYEEIQKQIDEIAWKSANEQIKAQQAIQDGKTGSPSSISSSKSNTSTSTTNQSKSQQTTNSGKWYVVDSKNQNQKLSQAYNSQEEAARHLSEYSYRKNGVTLKKFHTGLENGLVGSHSLNDDFEILQKYGLRKLNSDETFALLKNKEAVLTEEQISNVAEALRAVPPNLYPNLSNNAINNVNKNVGSSTSISIGDIHLHGVQNVDGFADAIVKYLPGKMLQAINRR